MKRNADRPDASILVVWLRELHGWDQTELAQRAGLTQSQISDYERGQDLRPETLEKILAAVNLPAGWAGSLQLVIRHYRELVTLRLSARREGSFEQNVIAAAVEHLQAVGPALLAGIDVLDEPPPPTVEEERQAAAERFERLSPLNRKERHVLVDRSPRFRNWAFVERLCTASREAPSPREAKEWSDLALRAARAGTEEEGVSSKRLEAYSLAHCANARRLADDPDGAGQDFRKAWELWKADRDELEDAILDVNRLLELEAALHRDRV
jgi:transcriptional regulator with XRE-family HTH domain